MSVAIPAEINGATPFGHGMLKYFAFEDGYLNVNNGSYGAVPVCIDQTKAQFTKRVEACTERWFRYHLYAVLFVRSYEMHANILQSLAVLAKDIGVDDAERLAFVANASAGVNSVLRSIRWQKSKKNDETITNAQATSSSI